MAGSAAPASAAVFLDRDGVINELVWDEADQQYESPYAPDDVRLIDGAAEAMAQLSQAGFALCVVSNQPGAAKGKTSHAMLDATHERVRSLLSTQGVQPDDWQYCFHHPDAVDPTLKQDCGCRKPAPGMIIDAARRLSIDLANSWMIGDADRDVEAGQRAGARTVLIEYPHSQWRRAGNCRPDAMFGELSAAAQWLNATIGRSGS